ncbi:glycosyltransferase family 4 protein [Blautia sp.]
MKIYEIGTGYTSIPAKISAATEIVVEQLTEAMIKNGEDVTILDIFDRNRKDSLLPIREIKIPLALRDTDVQLGILHKLKRVVYSISLANELKKILESTDEKVVFHFHNQYNMFFFLKLVPLKYRRKCIMAYTNHSGIWRLDWAEIKNTIKKRYFQEAVCMKYADHVYALNRETVDNACSYLEIPKKKFTLIDNGVNTSVYTPLERNCIEAYKRKYNLSDKKVILQVGSVYENKGQLRTIKNIESTLRKYSELVFVYAGGIVSEDYKNEIDAYVDKHQLGNKVKYFGMITPGVELNKLYNIAECTILSSRYEGFSLVVVESMASGVPVMIDAKTPFGLGKGNILYTDETFANVLENEVLQEERLMQHKSEARKKAVENYSWMKIANDYLASWENE